MRAPVVLLITLCGLLAGGVTPARAASFTVSLDTSALVGLGTFELDFQLVDGDGVADTTVILRGFTFGGGSSTGSPTLVGGASGSLATELTLQDTAFFNRAAQAFTPGATLSFLLEVSGSSDPSSPDFFSVALLDASGFELPTLGFAEELLSLALVAGAAPESFGTDPDRTDLNVPAPTVTAVPEPATALLVLSGVLLASARYRDGLRERRRSASRGVSFGPSPRQP